MRRGNPGVLLLYVIFFCTTSCTQKQVTPQPIINPVPHFYFTIHGHMAPTLISKNQLTFLATYSTHSEPCQQSVNAFEGIYNPYIVQRTLIAKPNAAGMFELKIPLDYYERGPCDWQIDHVAYQFSLQETHVPMTVATFLSGLPFGVKALPAEHWLCLRAHCTNQGFFTVAENLPTTGQYIMNLFFEEKS